MSYVCYIKAVLLRDLHSLSNPAVLLRRGKDTTLNVIHLIPEHTYGTNYYLDVFD
jgi:hypothetical protein